MTARAIADSEHGRYWTKLGSWDNPPVPTSVVESWRQWHRDLAAEVITAAAPHLIAEGRRQAAEAIRKEAFPEISQGALSSAEWCARVAEGSSDG